LNPVSDAGSAALAQFQEQGNAAERYERWVVPFVVGPWVPGLLDLAALRPGERVLDIATGTGVVARLAARRVSPGGAVTGLDLNRAMLAEARGSALDLPFHDGTFDVVVSQTRASVFPRQIQRSRRDASGPDARWTRSSERVDRSLAVFSLRCEMGWRDT
jgi:SAM-dependent methyltransferase